MTSAPSASAVEVVGLEDVEILESTTSRRILACAEEGATGELVCSCHAGRVHVYLQRGRVAWASDGRHPRAFTGHLKHHAGLATAAIEEVVAECRSTHRPIGETLLARGLANEEQVRAALRHQIGLALHVGECRHDGEQTFTARAYGEYDPRFTFAACEVVEEEQDVARACYEASARGAPCGCQG
ncbi:MAG TPA: DUF4388 domain-containing protein [Anaeromyxobacteraceae bacterium]|nr:DUF4388 domain-containing protein [Anaeromyxobacteraceae bacterium]